MTPSDAFVATLTLVVADDPGVWPISTVTALRLSSSSQAEEAGFLAIRDLAAIADSLGIEYRVVGGQMVRLHVARAGVEEPVVRVTQDADMGIAAASARDPSLVPGFEAVGYTGPGASNRFRRTTDDGLRLVIVLRH